MHTTLTPSRLHDARFCSLKKPRSVPYNSGTRPKACLWCRREGATWISSDGFPFSTSYCVIRPCALSARKTLWPNSMGVRTLDRLHPTPRRTPAIAKSLDSSQFQCFGQAPNQARDDTHHIPQQRIIGRMMDVGLHHRGVDPQLRTVL